MVDAPADAPFVAAWPAILSPSIQFGEVTVGELTSAADLHTERVVMQHCVASHDRTCGNVCLKGISIGSRYSSQEASRLEARRQAGV